MLVTLVGAGGVGKSRLAEALTRGAGFGGGDRALIIDLSVAATSAEVAAAVVTAVGSVDEPGTPWPLTVAAVLGDKTRLLVLDNCEVARAAVADLVRTLALEAPTVKILVTSREALGVEGEVLQRLEGLDELAASELFTIRAQQRGRLMESDGEGEAVLALCRRLDGVPLALELAAAQTDLLAPQELVDRLDAQLDEWGDPDRPPQSRHGSLRVVIESSVAMLEAEDRVALARLSVFADDFDLAGATAVFTCDGPAVLTSTTALAVVSRLVRSSLLRTVPVEGRTRYRMLEAVRLHGRQTLEAMQEMAAVRRAQVGWAERLLDAARIGARGDGEPRWRRAVTTELTNILDLLGFLRPDEAPGGGSDSPTDSDALAHLVAGLLPFLEGAGRVRLARRWVDIAAAGLSSTGPLSVDLSLADFRLSRHIGVPDRSVLDRAEAMAVALHDPNRRAEVAMARAAEAHLRGDGAMAAERIDQALALYGSVADRVGEARALRLRGRLAFRRADMDDAASDLHAALSLLGESGPPSLEGALAIELGRVESAKGNHAGASHWFLHAADRFFQVGDPLGQARALGGLADEARETGDLDLAEALVSESIALIEPTGDRHALAGALDRAAHIQFSQSHFDEAGRHYQRRIALLRATHDRQGEAGALIGAANVLLCRDPPDLAGARDLAELSVARFGEVGDRVEQAYANYVLAEIARDQGDLATARRVATESLLVANEAGSTRMSALARYSLGDVALVAGDVLGAAQSLGEAVVAARRAGLALQQSRCLASLAEVAARADLHSIAAELLGRAEAQRATTIGSTVMRPALRIRSEQLVSDLRTRLGSDEFDRRRQAGAAMTTDVAVDLALSSIVEPVVAGWGGRWASTTAPGTPAVDRASFHRDGDVWILRYAADEARLRNSKGLQYLALLVQSPGREFPAGELVVVAAGHSAPAHNVEWSELAVAAPGAGEVVWDERARREFKRRLHELHVDLDEAESWNDPERATAIQAEIDALTHELTAAFGLAGRPRASGDSERARKAVTNRIREAIAKIGLQAPALGRHLTNSVRTGLFCTYEPERPIQWSTASAAEG